MKRLLSLLLVALLLFVPLVTNLCSPVYADDDSPDDEEEEIVSPSTPTVSDLHINPVRVLDYNAPEELGTVRLHGCDSLAWTLLDENGNVFNQYNETMNAFSGIFTLYWYGVDMSGKHPAGRWNAPATVQFRLQLTATGRGNTESKSSAFTYAWYDSESANPFEDVESDSYYFDAVLWAVRKTPQITNGMDETHFSPLRTCTRAQVVTFLWRAKGSPEPVRYSNPFKDVKASGYYYKAVLWAVSNNITNGMSKTEFMPNYACTRGQVVTFLWRTAGSPNVYTSLATDGDMSFDFPFTDVREKDYYYEAVLWAIDKKITTGTTGTTFSPSRVCTRGQIVTFLYRCYSGS